MLPLILYGGLALAAPPHPSPARPTPPLTSPEIERWQGEVRRLAGELRQARRGLARQETALHAANLQLEAATMIARAAQLRRSGKNNAEAQAADLEARARVLVELAQTDYPGLLDLQERVENAVDSGDRAGADRLRHELAERTREINAKSQRALHPADAGRTNPPAGGKRH